jgi:DNA-binding phage protein
VVHFVRRTEEAILPTSYYQRRRAEEMQSPEFRAEYEQARAEIAQVDAIMRQLDTLRVASGFSKAELARQIGRNPSTVRRLFTAEVNPELKTVAALASALGARLEIVEARTEDASARRRSPRSVA